MVVSTDNERRADVVVAYITSIRRDHPDAVAIGPGAGTGLKAPYRCFGKIATIDKGIIVGRIATRKATWLINARKTFFGVFGFGGR